MYNRYNLRITLCLVISDFLFPIIIYADVIFPTHFKEILVRIARVLWNREITETFFFIYALAGTPYTKYHYSM